MLRLLLAAAVVEFLTMGCSIPWSKESHAYRDEERRAEKRWESEQGPSQSDIEQSADTVIRLRKQLGKE